MRMGTMTDTTEQYLQERLNAERRRLSEYREEIASSERDASKVSQRILAIKRVAYEKGIELQ